MTPDRDAAPRDASGDALLICTFMAADPHAFGGVVLSGGPGPGRDAFIKTYHELTPLARPFVTIPSHVSRDRLDGGLDLAATLASGKPVKTKGLMADARNGTVMLLSAERLTADKAAHLALAMDNDTRTTFGVIACDESRDDEDPLAAVLAERLAFRINPDHGLAMLHAEAPLRTDIAQRAHALSVPPALEQALAETALLLGISSPRALIFAYRVAQVHAALSEQAEVTEADIEIAAQLVFAHRATQIPAPRPPLDEEIADRPQKQPDGATDHDHETDSAMADRMVDAIRASLPADLLARLDATAFGRQGRSGGGAIAAKAGKTRGRPVGSRRGDPRSGARLDLIETLRVAAPWQKLRRRTHPLHRGVIIRKDDFRVKRFKERRETTAIFIVDASGSSAIRRLAEAKGAVELILADCYVRRDRVAVIAFRSKTAEILLPPTRSLQRAKRSLADLPGGGGTPLTAAIQATLTLSDQVQQMGGVPLAVFLTDGRANITSDGTPDKKRALEESHHAAKALRARGVKSLVIDLADRPEGAAKTLAQALDALYLPLPHAQAQTISTHVGIAMKQAGSSS